MKEVFSNTSLTIICSLFGRSRQAWYEMGSRKDGSGLQHELILSWVHQIRTILPRVGCVKLLHILEQNFEDHLIHQGRDAFSSLLRKHGLLIQKKKRYVTTTNSHHHFKRWPDLINRTHAIMPEQVWVSDITYLRTEKSFVYLFLITDAYSRKIVGYHLSQSLKASGCVSAINKALKERMYPKRPLIHHSDRGIQYCCEEYVSLLLRNKIQISMTQSGSPYDNAIAERINGILKVEFGLDETFLSYADAVAPTHQAVLKFNQFRPHLSCGLMTPQARHEQFDDQNKKNKKDDVRVNPYLFFHR